MPVSSLLSAMVSPRPPPRLPIVVVLLALDASMARAGCNIIPSATTTYRGALGATNRPYAGPGDFVEVGVEPGRCDALSRGFAAAGDDHVVTPVFKPAGFPARVAFL